MFENKKQQVRGFYLYKNGKVNTFSGCSFVKFCGESINLGFPNPGQLLEVKEGIYVKKDLIDQNNTPSKIYRRYLDKDPKQKSFVSRKRIKKLRKGNT